MATRILLPRTFPLPLLILLSLMACSSPEPEKAEAGDDNQFEKLVDYLGTPQFGPEQELSGKALFGLETSIIGLCKTDRAHCSVPRNVDGSEQACWLVFAPNLKGITIPRSNEGHLSGEYWVVGRGRIAVRPGTFGHLGQYTCQVEVTRLDTFEEGPPWMWMPPPPTVK